MKLHLLKSAFKWKLTLTINVAFEKTGFFSLSFLFYFMKTGFSWNHNSLTKLLKRYFILFYFMHMYVHKFGKKHMFSFYWPTQQKFCQGESTAVARFHFRPQKL